MLKTSLRGERRQVTPGAGEHTEYAVRMFTRREWDLLRRSYPEKPHYKRCCETPWPTGMRGALHALYPTCPTGFGGQGRWGYRQVSS